MRKTIILLTLLSITILSILSSLTNIQAVEISDKTKIIAGSCAGLTGVAAGFYCYKKANSYAKALQLFDQLNVEEDNQTKARLKRKQRLCNILTIFFAQVALAGAGVAAWGALGCLQSDSNDSGEPLEEPEAIIEYLEDYPGGQTISFQPLENGFYILTVEGSWDNKTKKYHIDEEHLQKLKGVRKYSEKMLGPGFKVPPKNREASNPEVDARRGEFDEYLWWTNKGPGGDLEPVNE